MGEIISITDKLLENGLIIARCPECNNDSWYTCLNALGDDWDKITGQVCTQCGFEIDWVIATREVKK